MKIAIYPDKSSSESYSEKWAEFLNKRNIQVKWVDLTAVDVLEQVRECDGLMWRVIHIPKDKQLAKRILYIIEKYMNIPVFPNYNTYWHYDDKIAQNYLLKSAGIPMPETWVFWNKDRALSWTENAEYPKVFKLAAGAGSSNVIKVTSKKEAQYLINRMFNQGIFPMTINEYKPKVMPRSLNQFKALFYRIKYGFLYVVNSLYPPLPPSWWQPEKDYIYFQEFIPENQYDTRITIIGNRAFGFRRFNRDNDFRASGSGKFNLEPSGVDLRCIRMALDVSNKLNFQNMAYDFLIKNNYPMIVEISYTCPDHTLIKCPGYWNVDLTWVEGNMWPEEAQVEDFIEYIKEAKSKK